MTGSFAATRVAGPVVRRDAASGRYRLWFTGSSGKATSRDGRRGSIGLAESADGLAFIPVSGGGTGGALLEATVDPDRFDNGSIAVTDVATTDGRTVLWYVGARTNASQTGPGAAVRAVSSDGLRFQRDTGPLAGALLAAGTAVAPELRTLTSVQVLAVAPRDYRIYFSGEDRKGRSRIYHGRSRDGRSFAALGVALDAGAPGSFDGTGVGSPQVVATADGFLMAYEGRGPGGSTGIGIAQSQDGVTFTRQRGGAGRGAVLLAGTGPKAWDGGAVGQPCPVVLPDGRLRLYYAGAPRRRFGARAPPAWRIGAAEAAAPDSPFLRIGPTGSP